jgi:hypothetical protein
MTMVYGPKHAAQDSRDLPLAGIGEVEPELDQPIRMVGARLWAGFLALTIIVGASVGWGFFGSMSRQLSLSGIVTQAARDTQSVVRVFATSPADAAKLRPGQPVVIGVGGAGLSGHIAKVDPLPSTGAILTAALKTPLPGVVADGSPVWTAEVSLDAPVAVPTLVPVQASVELPSLRPYQVIFGTQS